MSSMIPPLACALLLAGSAWAKRPGVPGIDAPQEEADPALSGLPAGQDLHALIKHLGDCIASLTPSGGVPGIDLFLSNLQAQLKRGNDVPRDKILRNAADAREALRGAYNALAEADSPEKLPKALAGIKETASGLAASLGKNRESVGRLRDAAETARATVAAMTLEPPSSPGALVPVESLASISSLSGEINPLSGKLRRAEATIREAKALVEKAKAGSTAIEALAEQAASLDKDAVHHVGERRTSGTPTAYHDGVQSRDVILNAGTWLKAAVAEAEEIVRVLEREASRKMVEKTLEADGKTSDGKVRQSQSGERINYNHSMRLNDVIASGYDVAVPQRRPWWVNRARMAKTEATADSGKMDEALRDAEGAAQKAEKSVDASLAAAARIEAMLGRPGGHQQLAKLTLDVPAPKASPGAPALAGPQVQSKPIKIPHTLDVSDQEITQSYDSSSKSP